MSFQRREAVAGDRRRTSYDDARHETPLRTPTTTTPNVPITALPGPARPSLTWPPGRPSDELLVREKARTR